MQNLIIGSRVRIIGSNPDNSCAGTVSWVSSNGQHVTVEWDNGGRSEYDSRSLESTWKRDGHAHTGFEAGAL